MRSPHGRKDRGGLVQRKRVVTEGPSLSASCQVWATCVVCPCICTCDRSFSVMLLLASFCLEEMEARSSLIAHSPPNWARRAKSVPHHPTCAGMCRGHRSEAWAGSLSRQGWPVIHLSLRFMPTTGRLWQARQVGGSSLGGGVGKKDPPPISHAACAVLVSETVLYAARAFKLGFFFSSGKSERTIKTFLGEQERRSANWRVNSGAGWIGN